MTPGYIPYRTASYLAPVPDIHHLYAVMNDPCPEGLCLMVNVTSIRARYHDPACLLDDGDHPFIQHPSYMLYRLAATMKAVVAP